MNKFHVVFIFICFMILNESETYAYLDPNTGSIVVQVLVAVFVGGAVIIKQCWSSIVSLFSKKKPQSAENKETSSDQ